MTSNNNTTSQYFILENYVNAREYRSTDSLAYFKHGT